MILHESFLPRIAQMTQKTNQFNLTTKRYTDADIRRFVQEGWQIWCLSVADKFEFADFVKVFDEFRFCFFCNGKDAESKTGCLDLPVIEAVQTEKHITGKHRDLRGDTAASRYARVWKRRQIP